MLKQIQFGSMFLSPDQTRLLQMCHCIALVMAPRKSHCSLATVVVSQTSSVDIGLVFQSVTAETVGSEGI